MVRGVTRTLKPEVLTSLEGVLGRDNSLDDPIAFLPDHTDGLDLTLARIVASRQQALV